MNLALIMKEDFSELIQYLDGQFNGLEKRLDNRMDDLEGEVRSLRTAVDGYAHKADAYFQEMAMPSHKVNRLEKWILQIAEKTNIHLSV